MSRGRLAAIGGGIVVAAVLYLAYGHPPAGEPGYRSPFLADHATDFVQVSGFRIHHLEHGSGPPVVLIHGGGTWLYSFRHNFEPLARRFRVIALDMPGHGYTQRTGEATWDFAMTDRVLRELLDAKGITEVSIVGHSWGGGWALHFAQGHPERVRRLVLIGSSGLPGDDRLEWKLLRWPLVAEIMARLFRRSDVVWGLEAAFADPTRVTPEMVDETWAAIASPENRMAQVHYSRSLDWRETQRALAGMRTPTLVLWGAHDQYGSVSDGRALAEAVPGARFEVIPGAGHNAHEERPDEVNRLVTAFLAE